MLRCYASTPSTVRYQGDLTVVRVGNFDGAAVKGKPARPLIHNHFARPRPGLPAPGPVSSQTYLGRLGRPAAWYLVTAGRT